MLVYPLRARARARLADPEGRPEWGCGAEDLRSLRAQLEAVEDSPGRHGKRHPLGVVLALLVLAGKAAGPSG